VTLIVMHWGVREDCVEAAFLGDRRWLAAAGRKLIRSCVGYANVKISVKIRWRSDRLLRNALVRYMPATRTR